MATKAPETAVDICNLALHHCGEAKGITSIENPSNDREELCSRWYDQVRRLCLREQVWNFAQKYAVLARSGDGSGGYDDKYALPNDFIRLNVVGENKEDPITDYEFLDGNDEIHASEGDTLAIWYNRNITDVRRMDAGFINWFSLRLAQKLAYPLTKKKSVVDQITVLMSQDEPKAFSVDGQERPPRRVQRSNYLAARRGGTGVRDTTRYEYE